MLSHLMHCNEPTFSTETLSRIDFDILDFVSLPLSFGKDKFGQLVLEGNVEL